MKGLCWGCAEQLLDKQLFRYVRVCKYVDMYTCIQVACMPRLTPQVLEEAALVEGERRRKEGLKKVNPRVEVKFKVKG